MRKQSLGSSFLRATVARFNNTSCRMGRACPYRCILHALKIMLLPEVLAAGVWCELYSIGFRYNGKWKSTIILKTGFLPRLDNPQSLAYFVPSHSWSEVRDLRSCHIILVWWSPHPLIYAYNQNSRIPRRRKVSSTSGAGCSYSCCALWAPTLQLRLFCKRSFPSQCRRPPL